MGFQPKAGVPVPLRQNVAFPSVSDFHPISEKVFKLMENFHNFTVSEEISRFSSAKISDDLFFSHRQQIWNFPPIFVVSVHFPYFWKIIISPYFYKFPSDFVKFTCFLHTFCVFRFPLLWPWCIYASHNAHIGRPWPKDYDSLLCLSSHEYSIVLHIRFWSQEEQVHHVCPVALVLATMDMAVVLESFDWQSVP